MTDQSRRIVVAAATHTMWIAFGAVLVLIFSVGVSWPLLLFCVAALTVVRFGPVLLALLGSRFPMRERVLVAVYCVLGSVILHGVVATRLVGRLAGPRDRAARSAAA